MTNMLFPGRPGYAGPVQGWFGLLHHEELCEDSSNVMERVRYVTQWKKPNEVPVRLHNMIYLGASLTMRFDTALAQYQAHRRPIEDEFDAKLDALERDAEGVIKSPLNRAGILEAYRVALRPVETKHVANIDSLNVEVLSYICEHIPDHAWDGETLVFPPAQEETK